MTNLLDMLYDYGRITNLEGIIDEFDRLKWRIRKDSACISHNCYRIRWRTQTKLASSFANVVGAKSHYWPHDPGIIGGVILKIWKLYLWWIY